MNDVSRQDSSTERGNRTPNLLGMNQALFQLSYLGKVPAGHPSRRDWLAREDLHPLPLAYQASALTR